MALVTQNVTPVRSYSPFEGMSEAQRLRSAVPRGLLRFFSDEALEAKPVNDDIVINVSCSLPLGFAYIFSSLSWVLVNDRAADWQPFAKARIFNGLPNGTPGNEQPATFNMTNVSPAAVVLAKQRVLDFSLGDPRTWWPQPLVATPGAAGMTFIISAFNATDTVEAAGTQFFNAAFYQYELNQAVRYPLNNPLPVGIR